jgi:hypothetical protein
MKYNIGSSAEVALVDMPLIPVAHNLLILANSEPAAEVVEVY